MNKKCQYIDPYVLIYGDPNYCSEPLMKNSAFCKKHSMLLCSSCGKQAYTHCIVANSLICGMPLCKTCRCPNHPEFRSYIEHQQKKRVKNDI